MSLEAEQAKAEVARRQDQERGRYYIPCGRIEQFLLEIGRRFEAGTNRTFKCILRAGNSSGKSCLAANIASYLSDSYRNPWFDAVPILRNFKRPNRGRILTTANAAKRNYDEEFSKWLRRGQYKTAREGRFFNNKYSFKNGSEFDIF
ncbi:MAG: hypothetical protein WC881_11090, partial [Elusimicrobiota bacterium]